MSALVVIGSPVKLLSFLCVRLSIGETEAQEGQWNPTDAFLMQSGHIRLLHRWHRTPARRSG